VDTGSHRNRVYADCVDLSAIENASKQKLEPNRFELAGCELRPTAGALPEDGDMAGILGIFLMESVRPDNADPIPLQRSQHSMTGIVIRFVGLLLIFVVVMGLLWSR
jgi:hypothetical protein